MVKASLWIEETYQRQWIEANPNEDRNPNPNPVKLISIIPVPSNKKACVPMDTGVVNRHFVNMPGSGEDWAKQVWRSFMPGLEKFKMRGYVFSKYLSCDGYVFNLVYIDADKYVCSATIKAKETKANVKKREEIYNRKLSDLATYSAEFAAISELKCVHRPGKTGYALLHRQKCANFEVLVYIQSNYL